MSRLGFLTVYGDDADDPIVPGNAETSHPTRGTETATPLFDMARQVSKPHD